MPIVVTLITGTTGPVLDDNMIATAASGFDVSVDWLAPGVAADLIMEGEETSVVDMTIRKRLASQPIDVVVQNITHRRKKLLVADMDSTVITVECIDVLANRAGIGDRVADLTARTILGELDFASSLRERVALLAGTPITVLDDAWRHDVALTAGARTLVATMRAHGAFTALISGGFTWFTERVSEAVGFDMHQANRLIVDHDHLVGQIAEPVLDRGAKETLLRDLVRKRKISMADSLAVGDGANDIAMIQAAGLGVAFHGVDAVKDVAGASIEHGDLTALLYLQGYRLNEFVGNTEPYSSSSTAR